MKKNDVFKFTKRFTRLSDNQTFYEVERENPDDGQDYIMSLTVGNSECNTFTVFMTKQETQVFIKVLEKVLLTEE